MLIRYEWDAAKAASFDDAAPALLDPWAVTVRDMESDEERYVSIGMDVLGRVLVVVYTWRGSSTLRLISARRANHTERRDYARGCHEG
ncbi:MAG TPA: BrnT family toxin [Longimicrobium sp.]|nr:BrnT family toxin [Longimicrobium sp.]